MNQGRVPVHGTVFPGRKHNPSDVLRVDSPRLSGLSGREQGLGAQCSGGGAAALDVCRERFLYQKGVGAADGVGLVGSGSHLESSVGKRFLLARGTRRNRVEKSEDVLVGSAVRRL